MKLEFIQPSKPTQNSYIERFNKTCREELLDFFLFDSLMEVKEIAENWLKQYNKKRPHNSLAICPRQSTSCKNSPTKASTFGWHLLEEVYVLTLDGCRHKTASIVEFRMMRKQGAHLIRANRIRVGYISARARQLTS